MIKILIVIQAEGDVRIDFQYQEMLPPVMPTYVGNCEKQKSAAKPILREESICQKNFAAFVC